MTETGASAPASARREPATLAIVIPCLNEARHLNSLLPRIREVAERLPVSSETFVVDGGSSDGTPEVARRLGATVLEQSAPGYGGALRTAFSQIASPYIVTLDADFAHHPFFIKYLFAARDEAEIVIASRYAPGGHAEMPWLRTVLSRALNSVFRCLLSLPVRDMSSGYRLYHREALAGLALRHSSYAALQEILIKAYCAGYKVAEIPFHYLPRRGSSRAGQLRFLRDHLSVLREMWRVRNSILSADYDARAFDSRIPLQRWWQRRRYGIVLRFIGRRPRVLDVGCGSSRILDGAPQCVGLDIQRAKLRFVRRPGRDLVQASALALPFRAESFEVVVCSQVIEHVPKNMEIFRELVRVLSPGGSLIIGTPDYGSWQWPIIEKIYKFVQPSGYADEHITHFTKAGLIELLRSLGLRVEECRAIANAELIVHARK